MNAPEKTTKKEWFYAAILWCILAAAFYLRYFGLKHGFPVLDNLDETKIVGAGLKLAVTRSWNPRTFEYPSFCIYVVSLLSSALLSIRQMLHIPRGPVTDYYLMARIAGVCFSVSTIYLVYRIGSLLFSRPVGIAATVFISFAYLPVIQSVSFTVNSTMVFWITASFLFAALIFLYGQKYAYYILSGVCAGLAAGCKYNGVLCVLPMIVAHLCSRPLSSKKHTDRYLLAGLAVIPAAFIATTPFVLLDFSNCLRWILHQRRTYAYGQTALGGDLWSYAFYLRTLSSHYGSVQLLLAAAGFVILLRKQKTKAVLLACFPVVFYFFMGSFRMGFERQMFPLVPFLAVFSGYGIVSLLGWAWAGSVFAGKRRMVCGAVLAIGTAAAVTQQAVMTVDDIRVHNLPDTRALASIWANLNLPAGARVGREQFTPEISRSKFRVTDLGICGLLRVKNPEDFDYLIASSADYGRYLIHSDWYPAEAQQYKKIFAENALVLEIVPDKKIAWGPFVKILKVGKRREPAIPGAAGQ